MWLMDVSLHYCYINDICVSVHFKKNTFIYKCYNIGTQMVQIYFKKTAAIILHVYEIIWC